MNMFAKLLAVSVAAQIACFPAALSAASSDGPVGAPRQETGQSAPQADPQAGMPLLGGLALIESGAWKGGFRKQYWNDSKDFRATAENFAQAMRDAGFSDVELGAGGGWGEYWGQETSGQKNGQYFKVSAIIGKGSWVFICSWSDPEQLGQCY